ncbi:MAG: GNAT family N-acetyltransferase [Erysipelotrichaceae bacterium]|nr:GNAT family N-acetyltransferase [Erysipelotrichaceae bacterium]
MISKLNRDDYAGKKIKINYLTKGYYEIEKVSDGFRFTYKRFESEKEMTFEDCFFSEWLEKPVAYGAFENEELLGYVEGTIEQWNNRYRISNICVFSDEKRHCGIGTKLMNAILDEAKQSGARMVVLETQTCNVKAISFYQKNGFEIIGFDLFAYSNHDPERHEVRIEMGKRI